MSDDKHPMWRATKSGGIGGAVRQMGDIFYLGGDNLNLNDMIPANVFAERIASWPFRGNPSAPSMHCHRRTGWGETHLPTAIAFDNPRDPAPYIEPRLANTRIPRSGVATINMPRYRLKGAAHLGGEFFPDGAIIAWPFWPTNNMHAVNETAEQIQMYFWEFGEAPRHPDLMPSPWCLYHDEPFLPELRAITTPEPEPEPEPEPALEPEPTQSAFDAAIANEIAAYATPVHAPIKAKPTSATTSAGSGVNRSATKFKKKGAV